MPSVIVQCFQAGLLDIGMQCLNVLSSGTLTLNAEFLEHKDAAAVRSCASGVHLREVSVSTASGSVTRCYSHTAAVSFAVTSRRRLAGLVEIVPDRQLAGRRLQSSSVDFTLPRPFNLDRDDNHDHHKHNHTDTHHDHINDNHP